MSGSSTRPLPGWLVTVLFTLALLALTVLSVLFVSFLDARGASPLQGGSPPPASFTAALEP